MPAVQSNEMKNHVTKISNPTSKQQQQQQQQQQNSEKTNLINSDNNNIRLAVINNESNECLVKSLSTGSGETKHDNDNDYFVRNSLENIANNQNNVPEWNRILINENKINKSLSKAQVSSKETYDNDEEENEEQESCPSQINQSDMKRNRNESIKLFKKRFRSFSIDLMRQIELAHDMVDLRNSNFVLATHSAAAQQYNGNTTENKELDAEYGADETSDDEPNYLTDYYRPKKNKNDPIVEVDHKFQNEHLPSTSTSFNNQTDIERSSYFNVKDK